MKTLFMILLVATVSLSVTSVFAEGGGGIECPESSGVYSYLQGTNTYQENPFDIGQLAVLQCEYFTESEDIELEPLARINAVYHIGGELNQDLIDEYGCGAILGEQYSATYVSSENHFASVAFTSPPLLEAAANIMTQIEDQNLATGCVLEQLETSGGSTAEDVKEAIEEHEVLEDTAIEVSNEEVDEETIEIIVKEITEKVQKEQERTYIPKSPEILLPDWIKNNAEWWSTDQITDDEFSSGIEFMIKKGFIKIPATEAAAEESSEIPGWVKNNAGWWSEGQISDIEFVNGLQFLISKGIISVV